MSPIPANEGISQVSMTTQGAYQECVQQHEVTQKFADEGLSFKRLKVINVFSCSDEDDGTASGCHAETRTHGFKGRISHVDRQEPETGLTRSELLLLWRVRPIW